MQILKCKYIYIWGTLILTAVIKNQKLKIKKNAYEDRSYVFSSVSANQAERNDLWRRGFLLYEFVLYFIKKKIINDRKNNVFIVSLQSKFHYRI